MVSNSPSWESRLANEEPWFGGPSMTTRSIRLSTPCGSPLVDHWAIASLVTIFPRLCPAILIRGFPGRFSTSSRRASACEVIGARVLAYEKRMTCGGRFAVAAYFSLSLVSMGRILEEVRIKPWSKITTSSGGGLGWF